MISEKFIHPQVTLAISTMLSLTVFLMSVDGGIPRTEEIPIISNFHKIQKYCYSLEPKNELIVHFLDAIASLDFKLSVLTVGQLVSNLPFFT